MQKLFVANWKMNMPFVTALNYCKDNQDELESLATTSRIILCPSFPALYPIADMLKQTLVSVGAQTCSAFEKGAYTGQVSAQSLSEAGCCYVIVGHSEQRLHYHETDEQVAEKVARCIESKLHPIICIGEQKEIYEQSSTIPHLEKQIKPIIEKLDAYNVQATIAYEPIWSIGTGLVADTDYLTDIFQWLSEHINKENTQLIYGGSVDANNAASILSIEHVAGLLIGGASLNFQTFKKIVSLGNNN